ncbi:MAG: purine-nucleoside/S-methyl-5-thioadenosine phosphorylase / adenosine deaminase [Chloroflexota bacterium]|nr:purine-nucleoside/S-methyl-5-thioadenosine phosphorylase / adenosine deaminase [Chloroflexota bacterium]
MTLLESTWVERDGILRSPALTALGLVAGFTTRALGSMAGGVFPLDEQERNRVVLAERLGFDRVVRLKQVHGDTVVRADDVGTPWPEADAMWTATPGLLLGVAAADCVPVLVADPAGPIGAAHAGWQGTSKRIAVRLVEALVRNGAERSRLVAAIGPSIGPCCYVIDEPRAATIRERLGADSGDVLFAGPDGRPVFDLWSANAQQLEQAGVPTVERCDVCTRSGGADIWSYRGDAGRNGTGLGIIGRPR